VFVRATEVGEHPWLDFAVFRSLLSADDAVAAVVISWFIYIVHSVILLILLMLLWSYPAVPVKRYPCFGGVVTQNEAHKL